MIKIKVSWIRSENDDKKFKFLERLGFDVFKVDGAENIDKELEKLIKKEYDTIIITNELAGFSEDIIKKYAKNKKIKIIIS